MPRSDLLNPICQAILISHECNEALVPLHQVGLRELLIPWQWKLLEEHSLFLDAEQIASLCDEVERIFQELSVLRLRGADLSGLLSC